MKDEFISKRVIWECIEGWINTEKYYSGRNPKSIPLSELEAIIVDCPVVGEDCAYLKNKRMTSERINGQMDVLKAVEKAILPYKEADNEQ